MLTEAEMLKGIISNGLCPVYLNPNDEDADISGRYISIFKGY